VESRKLVDLSMPVSATVVTDPPPLRPRIRYFDHREGAAQMLPFFPGLTVEDLPDRPHFVDAGCGMGREATLYLCERGVQVVGTDAWSWDAPFSHTAKAFAANGDPSIIWEGHKAGREMPYYQMEKLFNLAALPGTGFTVMCFPVKIERGSAGWVRAVAVLDG
jgi:kynurenine formamidase